VLVKRIMRRIHGTRREEIPGGWRKLHDEEFHSQNIRVIKSRRME
jgi:hypothetical protein